MDRLSLDIVVNDRGAAQAQLHAAATAVLADGRLQEACPDCDPVPRSWPQACAALQLDLPVLPWYFSSYQMPDKFLGNYLSGLFHAYALAQAKGVPLAIITSRTEADLFQHYFPWLWHFMTLLPPGGLHGSGIQGLTARAKLQVVEACESCSTAWPHECGSLGAVWEELALPFGSALKEALNETMARFWRPFRGAGRARGWPGDHRRTSPRGTRGVAVHVRCGDALAENGAHWGLLPVSAYEGILRYADYVVLISAASRGSDVPFADECLATILGLTGLVSKEHRVRIASFWNEGIGLDLARLTFADVVVCGPSSTFCLWAALAAAAGGGEAWMPVGPVLMNGTMPAIPGLRWFEAPRLAKGRHSDELLQALEEL